MLRAENQGVTRRLARTSRLRRMAIRPMGLTLRCDGVRRIWLIRHQASQFELTQIEIAR